MAKPKSKIHPVFLSLIQSLAAASSSQAEETLPESEAGPQPRDWQMPDDEKWNGDVQDQEGVVRPFDRKDINQNYEETMSSASEVGVQADCTALKTQCDWVAAHERAFRMRHCSPVRAEVHAAARRRAHGLGAGILIGGVLQYAQDLVQQSHQRTRP